MELCKKKTAIIKHVDQGFKATAEEFCALAKQQSCRMKVIVGGLDSGEDWTGRQLKSSRRSRPSPTLCAAACDKSQLHKLNVCLQPGGEAKITVSPMETALAVVFIPQKVLMTLMMAAVDQIHSYLPKQTSRVTRHLLRVQQMFQSDRVWDL